MITRLYSRQCSCTLRRCKHIHTTQNLSYTPSQMNQLRQKGIPISNMLVNEELFFDGDNSGDMTIDPVLSRGFNEIDAWNLECDARKRLINAHKSEKSIYDD